VGSSSPTLKAFANLGPKSAFRFARPHTLGTPLNLGGPCGFNVPLRLTIQAGEQRGGEVGPFGSGKSLSLSQEIVCCLAHSRIIPP